MTNKAYGIINKHYETGTNTYMDTFKDSYEKDNKEVVKKRGRKSKNQTKILTDI